MALKVAKKKAGVKPAAKPKVAKRVVRKVAAKVAHGRHEARSGESFWVNNGPICTTIPQLRAAIASMSDEQFDYHTKRSGNDFAAWVGEALEHKKCAEKLVNAKTRAGALRALAICEDC